MKTMTMIFQNMKTILKMMMTMIMMKIMTTMMTKMRMKMMTIITKEAVAEEVPEAAAETETNRETAWEDSPLEEEVLHVVAVPVEGQAQDQVQGLAVAEADLQETEHQEEVLHQ